MTPKPRQPVNQVVHAIVGYLQQHGGRCARNELSRQVRSVVPCSKLLYKAGFERAGFAKWIIRVNSKQTGSICMIYLTPSGEKAGVWNPFPDTPYASTL
jgi:hypothetical protein